MESYQAGTTVSRSIFGFILILIFGIVGALVLMNVDASAQEGGPEVYLTPIPTIVPDNAIEDVTGIRQTDEERGIITLDATNWQQLSQSTSPSARAEMGFVYDTARNVILATGGSYGSTRFDQTWEFNGTAWTQQFPVQSPGGRDRPAIAYDPIRRVTVLFGGSSPRDDTFYNETWEYDGRTWVRRFPLNPPSPRNGARMAYDPIRGKMLMFGGYRWEGRMVFFDETWEYDGARWSQRLPANHPDARETAGLAYDSSRGVMVLFGGGRTAGSVVFNDTWEWDGGNWIRRSPATSPPARWAHALTYDQRRNRIILFGGLTGTTSAFNDTWEFDGNTWSRIVTSPAPPARWDHGMVYDAARDTTILFGGMYYLSGFRWRNDTWQYTAPLPRPTRPVVLLPGLPGSKLFDSVAESPDCNGIEEMEVWPNLAGLSYPNDNHLQRLVLQNDGYTPQNRCNVIQATEILDKIEISFPGGYFRQDFYEMLSDNLTSSGFKVELCPYDWRRFLNGQTPGAVPAVVDECVERALEGTTASQVDIVAHSTGGLVARQYILSNRERADKVHTIVSLGTPYLGTLKAFVMLRYGESLDGVTDFLVNNDRIKEVTFNSPAFYQLLPSKKFFDQLGLGYLWSRQPGDSTYTSYLNYDSMRNFLERNFNGRLVEVAHNFHTIDHAGAMDDWRNDSLDVNHYVFVGTGVRTPRWIFEQLTRSWGGSLNLDYDIVEANGDGTVPVQSAELGGLSGEAPVCYYAGVDHGSLTSHPVVFNDLNKALRGLDLGVGRCILPGQLSAADYVQAVDSSDSRQLVVEGRTQVHVWDEQGRHAGPLSNGLIENNIPLATYQGKEDKTFVSLAPLSTYTITVQMQDAVPLRLKFRTVVPASSPDQAISQTVIFQDVPAVSGGQATIIYNPLADPTTYNFQVDLDANGAPELNLPPTAILDSQQSADREPPVSNILVEGQQDADGYFIGLVNVTIAASDNHSGLYKIEYSLDGGRTGQVYTGPFTVLAEEVPIIYAQATDRAGNSEYPWAESRLRPYELYLPLIVK